MGGYEKVVIAGGDTATPLFLAKRLALIRHHLPPPPVKFLDCGCGAGSYVRHLRQWVGVDAMGVEFMEDKVTLAHRDPALKDVVLQGNIERLPFPAASFDAALLNEVLEHVPNEDLALREINRVLKQGGVLILFSPNRWFPFDSHGVRLKRSQHAVPVYVPFIPYLPLAVGKRFFDYWARNYWPSDLKRLGMRNGFAVGATGFLFQTFENISGAQLRLVRWLSPGLRQIARFLEHTPVLRRFATSQLLVLHKPRHNSAHVVSNPGCEC